MNRPLLFLLPLLIAACPVAAGPLDGMTLSWTYDSGG